MNSHERSRPVGVASSLSGRQFGAYSVGELIGAGGMGQVYRARDPRLGRDVALKLLPPSVANDEDRRLRFAREARLLASISHPHIAAIHGLEEADGHVAIVLELVEGPTLADRLRRGALPVPDAVAIARQIAEALEAAHDKGIVHRDLKPANIKLGDRGVKVLDFGLAKIVADETAAEQSQLPTVTAAGTGTGIVMGTAAYMSPEQARGQTVDRRTDIWAFGCVLYEMLTGHLAFAGPTASDTIVAILDREPDWRELPEATPAHLRRTLRRCLEKDLRRRARDIGDVALDLAEPIGERPEVTDGVARRRWLPWVAGFGATALVAAAAAAMVLTGAPADDGTSVRHAVRFPIPAPQGASFGGGVPDVEVNSMALSPDGTQLAFVASELARPTRIWIRRLSSLAAEPIAGTEGAIAAFWSPDSRALGFFAGGKLKRVDPAGGAAVEIADVSAAGLSGSWGDGHVLFAPINGSSIHRVALAGTRAPEAVVAADASRGEVRVYWPSFLPDGRRFLYLAGRADGTGDVRIFEDGRTRSLLAAASNVEWVDPGYLVFAREGALLAQRVDLSSGQMTGEPFAITDVLNYTYVPARGMFTASRTGAIVYQSHRDTMRLARLDASGKEIEAIGEPGGYMALRVSRDRRSLQFARANPRYGTPDLWSADLARRGPELKLTSGPEPDMPGGWLAGPDDIVLSSGMPPRLVRRTQRTGESREMMAARAFQIASDVTPDGKHVVFSQRAENGRWDILLIAADGSAQPSPLFATQATEFDGRVSPDGRAIAWVSDESERLEVYVSLFPRAGGPMRVSTGGALAPRWSVDGTELFYLAGRQLMAAPIRTHPRLEVGAPRVVSTFPGRTWSDYDVLADGMFLAIIPDRLAREQPLTAVLNWPAEIAASARR